MAFYGTSYRTSVGGGGFFFANRAWHRNLLLEHENALTWQNMNTTHARYMLYVFLGVQLQLMWGKCKMPEAPEMMTAYA
jgi:hypothetical protein